MKALIILLRFLRLIDLLLDHLSKLLALSYLLKALVQYFLHVRSLLGLGAICRMQNIYPFLLIDNVSFILLALVCLIDLEVIVA